MTGRQSADTGRMNREWPMIRIGRADVSHHLGPLRNLLSIVVWKALRQGPCQVRLPRGAPGYRQCAVTRDQIAPMLLRSFAAHQRHEIAPGAGDPRREALVDQI